LELVHNQWVLKEILTLRQSEANLILR